MNRLVIPGLTVFLFVLFSVEHSVGGERQPMLAQAKKSSTSQDVVVAKVVGQPIYQKEITAAFRALPPRARRAGLQRHYNNLLENLVVSKMLTIYGRRLKLEDTQIVKRQLKRAEDTLVRDAYLGDLVRKQMTDEALKKEYRALAKKNKGLDEVRARHILVQTQKKAKKLIKLINTGQNFAELAKKNSVGRTARRGGDLGWFARGEMTKPVSDAAFKLKVGQVTKDPIKSDFGWHVIKLEEKRKRKIPPFDKVRVMIQARVGQRLSSEIVSELMRQTKVERFSFDGKQPIAAPRVEAPTQKSNTKKQPK
tara:strand:- start:149 stop:1075 length:927 start_codon:yes stop_codon:yes gene_type:complete